MAAPVMPVAIPAVVQSDGRGDPASDLMAILQSFSTTNYPSSGTQYRSTRRQRRPYLSIYDDDKMEQLQDAVNRMQVDDMRWPNTDIFMPTRITDKHTFVKKELVYDPQLPVQIGSEGVVPMVAYATEQTMVRTHEVGLGQKYSLERMDTAEGQLEFAMSAIEIINSNALYAALGAVYTAAGVDENQRGYENMYYRAPDWEYQWSVLVRRFAQGVKQRIGFATAVHEAAERMSILSAKPTVAVISPRSAPLFKTGSDVLWNASIAGPAGPGRLLGEDEVTSVGGVSIRTAPVVKSSDRPVISECILDTDIQLGEFYPIVPGNKIQYIKKCEDMGITFSKGFLQPKIFCEHQDNWVPLAYGDMVKNALSFRRGPNGGINPNSGYKDVAHCRDARDPFYTRGNVAVTNLKQMIQGAPADVMYSILLDGRAQNNDLKLACVRYSNGYWSEAAAPTMPGQFEGVFNDFDFPIGANSIAPDGSGPLFDKLMSLQCVPFNMIVLRPFRMYRCSGLLLVAGGDQFGFTARSELRYLPSADGNNSTGMMRVTMHIGFVVNNYKYRDMFPFFSFSHAYMRGSDVSYFTPEALDNYYISSRAMNVPPASIIVLITGAHDTLDSRTFIDVVGNTTLEGDNEGKDHYASAPYYRQYVFHSQRVGQGLPHPFQAGNNRICYRGAYILPESEPGMYGEPIYGTGHHGVHEYAGCMSVRMNGNSVYKSA